VTQIKKIENYPDVDVLTSIIHTTFEFILKFILLIASPYLTLLITSVLLSLYLYTREIIADYNGI